LPGLANALLGEVAETLRRKQDTISNFGSVRYTERVRRKLLQLARDYGRVTGDGVKLDLPLTHALLGAMSGQSVRRSRVRSISSKLRVF
jgi:CRP-like cAMP-binding protein